MELHRQAQIDVTELKHMRALFKSSINFKLRLRRYFCSRPHITLLCLNIMENRMEANVNQQLIFQIDMKSFLVTTPG